MFDLQVGHLHVLQVFDHLGEELQVTGRVVGFELGGQEKEQGAEVWSCTRIGAFFNLLLNSRVKIVDAESVDSINQVKHFNTGILILK